MDYHHVIEAAGVVSLGLIFYSYAFRWFEAGPAAWRWWRPVVTGLAFGVLAVVMMISRIQVAPDRYVDARAVPLALVTLAEGWLAGGGGIEIPPEMIEPPEAMARAAVFLAQQDASGITGTIQRSEDLDLP